MFLVIKRKVINLERNRKKTEKKICLLFIPSEVDHFDDVLVFEGLQQFDFPD